MIRETFPSELLPLVFEKMPDSVCTVSSTGVNQIRGEFKEHIIFGPSYETSYVYDGIYYAALRLADHLGIYHICVSGVNEIQLHYLAELCPEFSGKFSVRPGKGRRPMSLFYRRSGRRGCENQRRNRRERKRRGGGRYPVSQ